MPLNTYCVQTPFRPARLVHHVLSPPPSHPSPLSSLLPPPKPFQVLSCPTQVPLYGRAPLPEMADIVEAAGPISGSHDLERELGLELTQLQQNYGQIVHEE